MKKKLMNLKDQNQIKTTMEEKMSIRNEITNGRSNIPSHKYTETYISRQFASNEHSQLFRIIDELKYIILEISILNVFSR